MLHRTLYVASWQVEVVGMKYTTYLLAYEDGTESVPKRRHLNYRRRRITQRKAQTKPNRVTQISAKTFNSKKSRRTLSTKSRCNFSCILIRQV
jgi:hypothetical protein